MKPIKLTSILLLFVLLFGSLLPISSNAESFSEQTAFEVVFSKADAQAPGNLQGDIYLKTDPTQLITTFGCTVVFDTEYIDMVDVDGKAMTDQCRKDSTILGGSFPVEEATIRVGKKNKSFNSMQGLSIASYNAQSKQMYLFVCGLNVSGIKIQEKSKVATFYLNSKKDTFPQSALRTMRPLESGTSCPSKSVFVAEISSTTELGDTACKINLDVDKNLLSKEEPTTEAPTTEASTTEESTTEASTLPRDTEEPVTEEPTTLPVEEMSEPALEREILEKIEIADSITVPAEKQQTPVYKAYKKAVEKAQAVLEDKEATKEEKQEALQELREAQEQLEEEIPEVAPQIEKIEKEQQAASAKKPWVFIIIGGAVAVIAAAVIIVLILKKKKK